ncbi:MAG: winged helix DNA-binding protein [Bacteroidota bacterium]
MKKPIVKLVSEWSSYEDKNPGADIASFCRYILSRPESKPTATRSENVGQLARIIGRLSSAYGLYHRAAMTNTKLPATDSFYYLNCLMQLGEVKKMELINYLFAETTTGMEAINKLHKAGLVKERPDPSDGRAKLVSITDKGIKKLKECMSNAQKVNEMIFRSLDDDTISTCIDLLKSAEATHSRRSVELKQKPFNEMYKVMMKD